MSASIVRQVDGPVIVNGTTVQAFGKSGSLMAAGDTPPATSVVGLSNDKIILRLGPPNEGPTIKFTPDGIFMTFGLPGGDSAIIINADGITLAVGPVTKVQLQAGSVTIESPQVKVTNSGSITVEAPQVKVTGAANVAVSAPLIKLG